MWTFDARYPVFSSPVIAAGRVYVGEGLHEHADCRLYCLDLGTGEKIWQHQTSSHTESTPTVVDGKVYFGAGEDGIYCCDAETGRELWHFAEPHVDGCPLVVDGKVFFGSGYGFQGVYCLDALTGNVLWKLPTPAPVWGAPSFAGGKLYVALSNGTFVESAASPLCEVRCLDPKDGRQIWRCTEPTDGVLTSVALSAGLAVFGSRDGNLYAVYADNGTLRWKHPVHAPILSSPAIAGGCVFFGADDGIFRCVRLSDGEPLWSYDTTGDLFLTLMDPRIHSSPAVRQGRIVFGASNGHVYCLGPAEEGTAPVARTPHPSRLLRWTDAVVETLLAPFSLWTSGMGFATMLVALVLAAAFLPAVWFQTRQLAAMESAAEQGGSGRHPLGVILVALVQVAAFVTVLLVVESTATIRGPFLWIADLAKPEATHLDAIPWIGHKLAPLDLVVFACVWFVLAMSLRGESRRDPARQLGLALLSGGLAWLTADWSAGTLLFVSFFLLLIGAQEFIFLSGKWKGES
jgi:outer membrane protein assembly factor BamB